MSETNIETVNYTAKCCPSRLIYFLYLVNICEICFFALKHELRLLVLFLSLEDDK